MLCELQQLTLSCNSVKAWQDCYCLGGKKHLEGNLHGYSQSELHWVKTSLKTSNESNSCCYYACVFMSKCFQLGREAFFFASFIYLKSWLRVTRVFFGMKCSCSGVFDALFLSVCLCAALPPNRMFSIAVLHVCYWRPSAVCVFPVGVFAVPPQEEQKTWVKRWMYHSRASSGLLQEGGWCLQRDTTVCFADTLGRIVSD